MTSKSSPYSRILVIVASPQSPCHMTPVISLSYQLIIIHIQRHKEKKFGINSNTNSFKFQFQTWRGLPSFQREYVLLQAGQQISRHTTTHRASQCSWLISMYFSEWVSVLPNLSHHRIDDYQVALQLYTKK